MIETRENKEGKKKKKKDQRENGRKDKEMEDQEERKETRGGTQGDKLSLNKDKKVFIPKGKAEKQKSMNRG